MTAIGKLAAGWAQLGKSRTSCLYRSQPSISAIFPKHHSKASWGKAKEKTRKTKVKQESNRKKKTI